MKKIDLAQTITILANLGVIVGIVVLIVELNQNNDMLRFQARATLLTARSESQRAFAENAGGLVEIYEKERMGAELTWGESWRLTISRSATIHDMEALYNEVRLGTLLESDLPLLVWRGGFRDSNTLGFWNNTKSAYDPEFVQWMEENVVNER